MKRGLLLGSILIILVGTVFLGVEYMYTTDTTDDKELALFIAEKENIEKVDVLAKQYEKELLAVLYNDGQRDKLFILEQGNLLKNRYGYFGGGSQSSQFATYNFTNEELGSLVIAYGNNSNLDAYSYELFNAKKKVSKEGLGEYILDVYFLDENEDTFFEGEIYDKNKNVIGYFNSRKR